MTLLGLTTASVGYEVMGSTRSVNESLTRTAADAGFADLMSAVELDPNFFTDGGAAVMADRWSTISPSGSISPCPSSGTIAECYYLSYQDTPAVVDPSGQITSPEQAVVQVSAIHGPPPSLNGTDIAPGQATTAAGVSPCTGVQSTQECAAVAYRSLLIRRSYLDYLQFDNSEAMAPEAYPSGQTPPSICASQAAINTAECLYPAYQGQSGSTVAQDQIAGPFHTNSPFFLTCGDPQFTGPVEYASGGPSVASGDLSAPGCTGSPSFSSAPKALPPIPLPVPTALSSLQQKAPSDYQLPGGTSLVISATGISVGGASPTPYPPSGVVFVNGAVSVNGVVSGGLTIAASGNISVDGDLTYNCAGAGVPVPSTCTDMTGLISGGDILLGVDPTSPTSPLPGNLTVDAAMMAIGTGNAGSCGGPVVGSAGSIYSPTWLTAPVGNTITVNGALVENCRGAVGSYSSSTGVLLSGYQAELTYDSRFAASQPPDFLTPTGSQWTRVSVFGVPYGTPLP
jgi:hypothetical protein